MTRFNFKPFNPLVKTGQTTSYTANDDGTYQSGRTIGTRFVDNGDNTITDLATGLMWIKDHDSMGAPFNANRTIAQGLADCDGLSYAGYTDWRLPNISELISIRDLSRHSPTINVTFFPNTTAGNYVSSTTDTTSTTRYLYWDTRAGIVYSGTKSFTTGRIRPVRLGKTAQTITGKTLHEFGLEQTQLPTNQTTSYASYDDGDFEIGSPTFPRIVDNGDGTATDRHTGLMWIKNYNTTQRNFVNAISYCESLNYAGYTDWRLPNINELMSLIHFGKTSPVVIGGGILTPTLGSTNGRVASSTTNPQTTTRNFVLYFGYPSVQTILKTGSNYVWACRGGYK